MSRSRWFIMGSAAIGLTAAISLGVNGFAAASAGRTNNAGSVTGGGQASLPMAPTAPAGKNLQYYSIAASGFAPDGLHTTTEDYFNEWDPTTLSNQDSGRCFNASVHLPDGVKMVSATFYYTAGSLAMYQELNEQDLATHTSTEVVSFDSAIASTPTYTSTVKTIAKANQVVDTRDAYSLGVCPGGTSTFSGVTIAFTG